MAAAQAKDAQTTAKTEAAIIKTRPATTAASVTPRTKEVIKPMPSGSLTEVERAALLGVAQDIEGQMSTNVKQLTSVN